jgi:hypothetical protein
MYSVAPAPWLSHAGVFSIQQTLLSLVWVVGMRQTVAY